MNTWREAKLVNRAKEVLLANRKNGFTIPTANLYPFQWNWDSGFISLGYQHFELDFALEELATLFSGQWQNGMIPHILFHSENEDSYFPNHPFWDSQRNPGAPAQLKTSGITQPPVHGFVLEQIYQQFPKDNRVAQFIKKYFHHIQRSHQFFYSSRDPHQERLAYIYHPWESGRDNSPLWDQAINRIEIDPAQLPNYQRKDNLISNLEERPTDRDYDRYVYLLELGKRHNYDHPSIAVQSPFLIQDTLLNALLIRSNESLINLGESFGFEVEELRQWQAKSIANFNAKLWNEQIQFYAPYDLCSKTCIDIREIGGLLALFAGIASEEQAQLLHQYLQQLLDEGFFLCPSFDPAHPLFDSRRYWRGPIWPQMNWLIYRGLQRYGFEDTAAQVRENLLELVSHLGFYEYFEPKQDLAIMLDKGYGGNHFSWTAAVVLDLILAT